MPAYNGRGTTYLIKEDYARAIPDFSKAIELDPKSARACIGRGNAYSGKEDYERAIPDFSKAIELDPEDGPAYYNREPPT